MQRRTKIIATLGPASCGINILTKLLEQHVDIVRINFSHGVTEQHIKNINNVRLAAAKVGREVAVLADIQGPKIRISSFENGQISIKEGDDLILDHRIAPGDGTNKAVGIDYKNLYLDIKVGDILLLGDGDISLKVARVNDEKIFCKSLTTAILSDHKGINLQGGGLSAAAITTKDQEDIATAVAMKADYIALSFVNSAEDILQGQKIVSEHNGTAKIIAKIERKEAVKAAASIIAAADGVMIARGDLALEIGDAEVPGVQKSLIKLARTMAKPTIIATQMMESMIINQVPTRAEVSDVANAVLDGCDAVMLSAETAVGSNPLKVVEAVARVCNSAEKYHLTRDNSAFFTKDLTAGNECDAISQFTKKITAIDEAIAVASMYIANYMEISAIIALTENGRTPLWMSRARSNIPIYAMSRHESSRKRMMIYRDVYPYDFDVTAFSYGEVNYKVVEYLMAKKLVHVGQLVIITNGDCMGAENGVNAIKVVEVGKVKRG
jgi:pyruvate kinase